jgi:hypothetical protein
VDGTTTTTTPMPKEDMIMNEHINHGRLEEGEKEEEK